MEVLEAEGVQYIFGNPGTTEGAIMHALEGYPDLEFILVAQEGVAVGMADGYARESGRPGFVNLHIETGLSNGLSLMCNAYAGGTPMVVTAANSSIGKVAEGRTDLVDLARPFSKWGAEVTNADQLPAVMRRAFREAKTPPTGPDLRLPRPERPRRNDGCPSRPLRRPQHRAHPRPAGDSGCGRNVDLSRAPRPPGRRSRRPVRRGGTDDPRGRTPGHAPSTAPRIRR